MILCSGGESRRARARRSRRSPAPVQRDRPAAARRRRRPARRARRRSARCSSSSASSGTSRLRHARVVDPRQRVERRERRGRSRCDSAIVTSGSTAAAAPSGPAPRSRGSGRWRPASLERREQRVDRRRVRADRRAPAPPGCAGRDRGRWSSAMSGAVTSTSVIASSFSALLSTPKLRCCSRSASMSPSTSAGSAAAARPLHAARRTLPVLVPSVARRPSAESGSAPLRCERAASRLTSRSVLWSASARSRSASSRAVTSSTVTMTPTTCVVLAQRPDGDALLHPVKRADGMPRRTRQQVMVERRRQDVRRRRRRAPPRSGASRPRAPSRGSARSSVPAACVVGGDAGDAAMPASQHPDDAGPRRCEDAEVSRTAVHPAAQRRAAAATRRSVPGASTGPFADRVGERLSLRRAAATVLPRVSWTPAALRSVMRRMSSSWVEDRAPTPTSARGWRG